MSRPCFGKLSSSVRLVLWCALSCILHRPTVVALLPLACTRYQQNPSRTCLRWQHTKATASTVIDQDLPSDPQALKQIILVLKESKEELKQSKEELKRSKEELKQSKEELKRSKEEINQLLKKEIIRLEAELSIEKAKLSAQTNLRPLLEFQVCNWCKAQNLKFNTSTDAFDLFYQALVTKEKNLAGGDRSQDQDRFQECLEKALSLAGGPPISKRRVTDEVKNMFITLSKDMHNQTPVAGIVGFVVNRDAAFSAAASAMMMFFHYQHTVMTNGYTEVVYTWPETE